MSEPSDVGELVTWITIDGYSVRVCFTVVDPCPVDEWRSVARRALALVQSSLGEKP